MKVQIFIFFWREEEPKIFYWLKYNPRGPKYFNIDSSQVKDNIDTLKKFYPVNYKKRNGEYLEKAFELIGILKKLDMRWAGAPFGKFSCSFNDSSRLSYIKNRDNLDSSFYRFRREYEWIDSNFITFK